MVPPATGTRKPNAAIAGRATILLRWDFAALAELLGVLTIPHVRSHHRPLNGCQWPDEARARFDREYADDLALWGS